MVGALVQGVGERGLSQGRGLGHPALFLQRLDLLVDRQRQVVVLFVQLGRGVDRVLAQRGELLHRVGHRLAAQAVQSQRDDGQLLKVRRSHSAGRGELSQRRGSLALSAHDAVNRLGLRLKLRGRRAGRVAGQDQRAVVRVGFLRPRVVRGAQGHRSAAKKREGVDEAQHGAAQCSSGRRDATEHVAQLAALLQQHRQRRLPGLQAGHDVGQLRRHLTQRGSRLAGAQAVLVERPGGRLQQRVGLRLLGIGLVERGEVWPDRFRVHPALLRQKFEVLRAGAAAGLGGERDPLDGADHVLRCRVDLRSRWGRAFADPAQALGSFLAGLLRLGAQPGQ